MLKAEGLLAAIGEREGNNGRKFYSVTIVDQTTGEVDVIDVNTKREGLLDQLRAGLHNVVRLDVSHREYWNDTPTGRRPATVDKVESCTVLAHERLREVANVA